MIPSTAKASFSVSSQPSSSIRFSCPQCGGNVKVPPQQAGHKCRCPRCDADIIAPGGAPAAPKPPEAAVPPASAAPSRKPRVAEPGAAAGRRRAAQWFRGPASHIGSEFPCVCAGTGAREFSGGSLRRCGLSPTRVRCRIAAAGASRGHSAGQRRVRHRLPRVRDAAARAAVADRGHGEMPRLPLAAGPQGPADPQTGPAHEL